MNSTEYSSNEDFKRCLKEEKKFPTEKHIETSKRVKDIALNMVQSDSISEALVYAQQIADKYLDVRDTLLDYNDFDSKINEYCYWYNGICWEENALSSNAQAEMRAAMDDTNKVNRWFHKMGNHFDSMHNNVHDLLMVQSVKDANDVRVQEILETLKHGLDPGLVSLVKLTFGRILDSVNEVKEDIIKPREDLMEEIQALRKSLREYEESTVIDSNFFM